MLPQCPDRPLGVYDMIHPLAKIMGVTGAGTPTGRPHTHQQTGIIQDHPRLEPDHPRLEPDNP